MAFLFLGIPGGTFLILLGAVLSGLLTHFFLPSFVLLIVLVVLYLTGEVLDALFAAAGAKKFGASRGGVWGAFLGALAGGLLGSLFFGIGALPGLLIGIFSGAFLGEYFSRRNFLQSLKSGTGSVLGTLLSIVVKGMIGMVMLVLIAFQFVQKLK